MGEEDQNSKFHWAGSQFPIFSPRLPSLDSKQPQIQKREPGVDRESPRTIPPILAGDVGKGILNTINTGGNSGFCFIFSPSFSPISDPRQAWSGISSCSNRSLKMPETDGGDSSCTIKRKENSRRMGEPPLLFSIPVFPLFGPRQTVVRVITIVTKVAAFWTQTWKGSYRELESTKQTAERESESIKLLINAGPTPSCTCTDLILNSIIKTLRTELWDRSPHRSQILHWVAHTKERSN